MEAGHTVGSFTREPSRLPAMARERDGLARGVSSNGPSRRRPQSPARLQSFASVRRSAAVMRSTPGR